MLNTIAIVLIIIICVLAVCICAYMHVQTRASARGGHIEPHGNIVVDLLNATGYYYNKITHDNKILCIKSLTQKLKTKYTDRIMFVVKGKNTEHLSPDELADFQKIAEDLRIYIYVTEQYDIPTANRAEHYEQARDDFYMCHLANKYKCKLLTEDKLRDIAEFGKVPRFKIIEYAFWRTKPEIDFVNPAGIKIRKPRLLHYESI